MNPYISVVNQKISFCDILLKEGILKSGFSEKVTHQLELVFSESALHQLKYAYINYLKEIGSVHKCKEVESIDSIENLNFALEAIKKTSGEAQEINFLIQDQSSWLSQLLIQYKKLSSLPRQIIKKNDNQSASLLDVKQLDDTMDLNCMLLDRWRKEFIELISRNRELMYEC